MISSNIDFAKKKEWYFFLSVLLFFSVFIVFIYQPENKLYHGYDAFFHYNRIQSLMDAIEDGTFPVYIDSTAANGYGYGTKWFYSDFLLIPIALVAMATNIVLAYKLFVFFAVFLCGYFTYIATNKIFKSRHIGYLAAYWSPQPTSA
ncbi:hypothetical protein [Dysgonomonas sp. 520]|uniref:hypothetical protein n=1 Tax=Dysgonomonas sp. 520 TaxID=2302931 RepID=UPI001C87C2EF|nr:hypothetical protein [Dysgonomonas sp. 520]